MAKLSTKARAALPKADFGLPGSRSYPMPNAQHAALAKARATQAVAAGRMSKSTQSRINAQANKVIARAKAKKGG